MIPHQYIQSFHKNDDCSIHELFFASKSKSTMQSRKPWLVRQVLVDDNSLWNGASEIGLAQSYDGDTSRRDQFPFRSLPRLWKPDPLVRSYILPMLKERILDKYKHNSYSDEKREEASINNKSGNSNDVKSDGTGLVLDLGSGAGRDICYLAEEAKEFLHSLLQRHEKSQCMMPVHFVGIDNHKGSTRRCTPLWKNRGVEDITDSFLMNLNKLQSVRDHFMDVSKLQSQPVPNSDVVGVSRFVVD